MKAGSFSQSSLSMLPARGSLIVLLALCATCCITGHCLEDYQVAEQSVNLHESSCSTSEHCPSIHQSQDMDDTTIMLQSGRLKTERLSEVEFEDQKKHSKARQEYEPRPPEVQGASSSSPPHGSLAKLSISTANIFKQATVSLLSKFQGRSLHESMRTLSLTMLFGIILSIFLFFGCLLPCVFANRGTRAQPNLSPPASGRASPLMPRQSPLIKSGAHPAGHAQSRIQSSLGSPTVAQAPLTSPSPSFGQMKSPRPSALSMWPSGQAATANLPPPLCPTLVLPMSEVRFGVPMLELAQLTTEGELGIVGLSGEPLRAHIRRDGMHRSLQLSMAEAGSAPWATVGPNEQDANKPGQLSLDIRGPEGLFYGLLEMRAGGSTYVTKDGRTVMIIDDENSSIQLSIKTGGGVSLASVKCATRAGVDFVEIKVQPRVDTFLVLACALAVLLLSPSP